MDICSWDWGAIAGFVGAGTTIIAAIIAWNISEKWRDQKGDEIISNEAKNILILLNEYREKLENIHEAIINGIADADQSFSQSRAISELELLAKKIKDQSIFFNKILETEDQLIVGIKGILNKFNDEIKAIDRYEHQQFIDSETSRTVISRFDSEIKSSITNLLTYFKYKKKP